MKHAGIFSQMRPDHVASGTLVLSSVIARLGRGDSAARDELLRHAGARLEHLVRRQLRGFPRVRRWEETADVLQQVLIRLARALEQVTPRDARDFYGLSARMIRRELIDLKRHYYGPQGSGAHHATHSGGGEDESRAPGVVAGGEPGSETHDPSALAEWTEFHARVEALPPDLRDVVDLVWYQGLEQEEAAGLLGVSSKTVSRRWREARLQLGQWLSGQADGKRSD